MLCNKCEQESERKAPFKRANIQLRILGIHTTQCHFVRQQIHFGTRQSTENKQHNFYKSEFISKFKFHCFSVCVFLCLRNHHHEKDERKNTMPLTKFLCTTQFPPLVWFISLKHHFTQMNSN